MVSRYDRSRKIFIRTSTGVGSCNRTPLFVKNLYFTLNLYLRGSATRSLSGLPAYRLQPYSPIFFTLAKNKWYYKRIKDVEKNDNKALIPEALLVGFSNSVTQIIKSEDGGRRVKLYIVIAAINLIFVERTRSE